MCFDNIAVIIESDNEIDELEKLAHHELTSEELVLLKDGIDSFTRFDADEIRRQEELIVWRFMEEYYQKNINNPTVLSNFIYLMSAMLSAKYLIRKTKSIGYVEKFLEGKQISTFDLKEESKSLPEPFPKFLDEYVDSKNSKCDKYEFLGRLHLEEESSGEKFYKVFLQNWDSFSVKAEEYYQNYLHAERFVKIDDLCKLENWAVEFAESDNPGDHKKYVFRVFVDRYINARIFGVVE